MKNKDFEEMILTGTSLDDLIKMKIEQEFMSNMQKIDKKTKPEIVTDIKKVPANMVFSKNAVYKIFNRNTKCETYINGVQAEALIGVQNNIRDKMLKGELSAFATDDAYVKFDRIKL